MFSYTEEKNKFEKWGEPAFRRKVIIHTNGQPVGVISGDYYAKDGTPAVDRWHGDKPLCVEFYSENLGTYFRTEHIDFARTVAEGKKIFADWYKTHHSEIPKSNVRALPASPDNEFFPTPSALAGRMANLIHWDKVTTLLEPSAGKGDLVDCARKCAQSESRTFREEYSLTHVDCIEKDPNLRLILKGKNYRVVSDDFLGYFTMKHYDAIIMNPPFSNGDEHLLKAISMQKDDGGQIVCLLNAETIRNPYTQRRKVLQQKLAEYNARIEFIEGAFARAERKSDVEVAIVYINIPTPVRESEIFKRMKMAEKIKLDEGEVTDLVAGDWMDQLITAYNTEAKLGVELMREYNALAPYIMSGTSEYASPLIQLAVGRDRVDRATSKTVDSYLCNLRSKYWELLLSRRELTEKMTSALQREYHEKIREMRDYDFSRYNIQQVMMEISSQLSHGVEESIYKLFDELSAEHSWYPECANNIHYYNGWATNKAHKVGMKCILPINGFYTKYDGKKKLEAREFAQQIGDLERSLNYLDKGETSAFLDPERIAETAEAMERTTMNFKFFSATFYKKGTCHIKFYDEASVLIDRLNIFAARNRQWLPPDYGKKGYNDMDEESRAVVDSFQGKEAYEKVMANPSNYLFAPSNSLLMLEA